MIVTEVDGMKLHALISRNGEFSSNTFVIPIKEIGMIIVGVSMGFSVPTAPSSK
jgi:hypothetical protein